MIVKKRGMLYAIRNWVEGYQEVRFNRKRPDGSYSDGSTVEEVLLVLRDKFYHFQSISPSKYNEKSIKYIQSILELCQERLQDKKDSLKDKE